MNFPPRRLLEIETYRYARNVLTHRAWKYRAGTSSGPRNTADKAVSNFPVTKENPSIRGRVSSVLAP